MRWRRLGSAFFTIVTLCAAAALLSSPFSAPPELVGDGMPTGRQQVGLNADWRFLQGDRPGADGIGFDDAGWTPVSVPHTWNGSDGQDGGADYHRGTGWYRRHYTPAADLAGKRLWLQFDGANSVADVWVNGTHLGQHRGGYARFRFDATGALVPGRDNVIAVRVRNTPDPDVPPLSADYTFFGGIYREVQLLATDALAVDLLDSGGPGVYVRQRSLGSSAKVDVSVRVRNSSEQRREVIVRTTVTRTDGVAVAGATSTIRRVAPGAVIRVVQPITITSPRLWRGRADPYLYRANVEIRDAATGNVTDAVTERFGLRTVSIDPDRGLFLNGEHLALHGVNRHQDRLGRGWALTSADHKLDFDIMDEMGVNALRTAHYQQDQKVYDLADERGYLVWTEIPLVDSITDSPAFKTNAEQQLRELIRQNYNHPSIMFWGIGNEQHADDPATNRVLASLARLVAAEDPDRLSVYAHSTAVIDGGLTAHSAITGYNRYYGWYYSSVDQLGIFLDNLHREQPEQRIALSEYGAGGSIVQHEADPPPPQPTGAWHPEEYQALLHERYWAQISARPYLWGSFVWNMFDFAADQRGEGDTPGRNDKGLVTYDRATRKDAFYWYKANWTATPFVYITSRRWVDRTDPVTSVKVYGTADSVTLKVNGVQVGAATPLTGHAFTWPDVTLAPGTNTIEVTGAYAGTAYTDTATWTLTVP
ncbi:glycoside hydrolase family 2 TIM barrel-domain containing protein [Dactylosporangium sp. NPDC005572]|uniref:glycoside hydrolase family 2 TIM barrel-domain containing protein n=1 Tax=Dactylosporangium sp. NPDC005572 TaxID=3156889 RepID=UPI0033A6D555